LATAQRQSRLLWLLRWMAVLLIVKVTGSILANYRDYFPPDFASLFLEGRENRFWGTYSVFFYIHILASPLVLVSGLILFFERIRMSHGRLHRSLGRIHVFTILVFVIPSAMVMSADAFAGWRAGLSFFVLSLLTGTFAVLGVLQARRRRFASHRRWMFRCYVLLCSAIVLRMISGAASVIGFDDPETAYYLAAWASWIVPIAICEIVLARKSLGFDHRRIN
jgi:uncharacterized membrane protein